MFTNTTEIIKSLVNSVDYSKQNFSDYKSIDWSSFDLSSVPSADFSSLNTILNIVSDKVNEWGARINCSRMGAEKKDRGLQIINSIKLDILNLGSDKERSRYETANYIKQKLDVLSDNVPIACKNSVCESFRKLGIEINKISMVEGDRHFILSCVAEKVVENSEKYRVNVQKENISQVSQHPPDSY